MEEQKQKLGQNEYLACEKAWVFMTLMYVGGFLGAFTYSIRGGVFCNAQTGNVLLFAMALGNGEWAHAMYYFIPMSAYFLGAVISESIAGPIKRLNLLRWDTIFIMLEMAAVVVLGLLPESAPFQISQVLVNFICSMQYNTFRQAEGIPMATTFCTNHVRQVGVSFSKAVRHKGEGNWARCGRHLGMLASFAAGGATSTALCRLFLGRAAFAALLPLGIVLANLLYADLKKEKGSLQQVPHGH
ncbi:MAG: YoaK family protein [Oscillospiraceae bacterium]